MTIKKLLILPLAIATMVLGAGQAGAQMVSPILAIQLTNSGLTSPLVASSEGATVARLVLDTTGSTEAVRISSLPFILSTSNGALASTLSDCRVYNEANADVAISGSTSNSLVGGVNNIVLSNTMTLPAGSVTTLALRCDVGSNLVTNGTYTFSMNTANVAATGATTGLPAVVTVRGAAPVVVPPVVVIPPIVPGMPVTGANGNAATNIAALLGSVLVAALGFAYIKQSKNA